MSLAQYTSGSSGPAFAFSSAFHGDILPGLWDAQVVAEQFFGVAGEAHLIGATGGRDLICPYDILGAGSSTLLGAQLVALDAVILQLTGDLAISGNIAGVYPKCTFLGYERASMFFDGSGVNGWCVFGRLRWRQRAQS
jgi:hypothetical protein